MNTSSKINMFSNINMTPDINTPEPHPFTMPSTTTTLRVPASLAPRSTDPLALDFPVLDPFTRRDIVVPEPKETDPEFTKCAALPSFPSLKKLPHPNTDPAYHAAAIDVLRITSWRLNQHGPYEQPLHEEHLTQLADKWRAQHPDAAAYPLPPDLRVLLVKSNDAHPAEDEDCEPLWTRACEMFRVMDTFWKPAFQKLTRNQHIVLNHRVDGAGLEQEEMLYMRIFVRYLVWREWTIGGNSRPDVQPTRKELEALFADPEVQKVGLSLADICQQFPNAKDVEQLVYRVQGLAVLLEKEDVEGEPVESVYMPKPAPTEEEIVSEILKALRKHDGLAAAAIEGESSGALPRFFMEMYPFGFGHEEAVAAIFEELRTAAETEQQAAQSPPSPPRETTPPPSPSPTEVGITLPSPPPSAEKKRKRAVNDDEPGQPSPKKGKTQPDEAQQLVRCDGLTKAGQRCKLKCRRSDGETWLCSKHR